MMRLLSVLAIALLLAAGPATAQTPPPDDRSQAALRAYQARDFRTAAQLWLALANAGDGAAQYNLGRLYARGEGVRRDLSEAYKWFTLARAAGRREGETALLKLTPTMTAVEAAEGLRRAEQWRQQRRR